MDSRIAEIIKDCRYILHKYIRLHPRLREDFESAFYHEVVVLANNPKTNEHKEPLAYIRACLHGRMRDTIRESLIIKTRRTGVIREDLDFVVTHKANKKDNQGIRDFRIDAKDMFNKQQQNIIDLMSQGYSGREIGVIMGLSPVQVTRILNKIKAICKEIDDG